MSGPPTRGGCTPVGRIAFVVSRLTLQCAPMAARSLPLKLLVLLLGVMALLVLLALSPLPSIPSWGWDVAVYRAGSKALLNGENPYLPENIPRFADGADLATIPYYVYSPAFAVLFAPLALLPPWLTIRVWFILYLVLYLASGILITRLLNWRLSQRDLLALTLGLALYPPLRTQMVWGQSAIVMLFILTLSIALLRRGRPLWAGAVLSLGFFKPHLVLLLPFFAIRRQWRYLTGFVVGLAVTTLPFLGWVDDWLRALVAARAVNVGFGCLPFSSLNMLLRCYQEGS